MADDVENTPPTGTDTGLGGPAGSTDPQEIQSSRTANKADDAVDVANATAVAGGMISATLGGAVGTNAVAGAVLGGEIAEPARGMIGPKEDTTEDWVKDENVDRAAPRHDKPE